MPVEMIGWVAARVSSELIPPSGPPFDAEVIAETARIHEQAGFDRVLIGYFSDAPDGFLVGAHAASVTERLGLLLAHRPGFVAPPVAARKLATLDQLSDGRLAVHIIAGASDADQAKDGDWTDHGARYRRSAEYMSLLRRTWTEPAPFDHQGEFYRTQGTYAEIRCRQQPHIPIYGGGGSDAAIRALAGPACRCLHALGRTAEGYSPVYGSRAPGGRTHRPQPDLQPFNPPDPRGNRGQSLGPGQGHSGPGADQSGWRAGAKAPERRLPTASAGGRGCRGARHLWTSLAVATGAQGNSTALVGTPETVAKAMLEYYKLGATGLLIRGYDPRPDAVQYGEDLIPRLRKLVADYDAGNDAGNDAASDTAGVAFRSGRPGCNAAH